MARIRSIHPGQWTDEQFVSVSFAARLLALGLRNEADDNGVFEWKPITIKMRLFAADNVNVADLLDELSASDIVQRFDEGGKSFGAIRNFRRWQRPEKPNSVHPLPERLRKYVGLLPIDTPSDGEKSAINHAPSDSKSPAAPSGDDDGSGSDPLPIDDQSSTGCRKSFQRKEEGGSGVLVVDDDEARARAKFDLAAATERVIAAAGADPSKQAGWMMASVSVGKWLARGADLELDILPTIGAVAVSREGRGPPNSPSYFDRAIVEAMARRLKPLPDVLPSKPRNGNRPQPVDTLDVETARWKARVSGWVKSKIWREADWGPPPDDPDCWAPAVLLVDLHQRGAA